MTNILHNKFFSIIYTIIRDIFFFVVILYLAFILLQRISGNNSIYGYRLFTVVTGSMTGVYDINDVIAVKDYDVLKLKVGDDIAYHGARVVGVVPIISVLNHVIKSQLGFFALVFCPLVIVIVLEVLQTITDIKLEKEEIREINHNDDEEKGNEEKEIKNNNDIEIV